MNRSFFSFLSSASEWIRKDPRVIIPYVSMLMILHLVELYYPSWFKFSFVSFRFFLVLSVFWLFELLFRVFSASLLFQASFRKEIGFLRSFFYLPKAYVMTFFLNGLFFLPFLSLIYFKDVSLNGKSSFLLLCASFVMLLYALFVAMLSQIIPVVVVVSRFRIKRIVKSLTQLFKHSFLELFLLFLLVFFMTAFFLVCSLVVASVPVLGPSVLSPLVEGVGMTLSMGVLVSFYKTYMSSLASGSSERK